MFEILFGAALTAVAVVLLVHFRARGGKVHPLVALPGMEVTMALCFVALFAMGITMMASGVLSQL